MTKVSLNRDHGKVDTGLPVLRVVAPVWSPAGTIFGMLVINVHAAPLLHSVLSDIDASGDIYVVTESGGWMVRTRGGPVSTRHLTAGAAAHVPVSARAT